MINHNRNNNINGIRCLDMGFREDESRARKDHAGENLNIIRHMTMNMLKKETTLKAGIAGKRLKCG